MANTQEVPNSFKLELLSAIHDLSGADTLKAALYLTTATIDKNIANYTVTGEVSGSGYTAGGINVTNATAPALDGDIAHWTPSASLVWNSVTLTIPFDCVLLYNSTKANRSVGVFTFGSQTITSGNFSLTMPVNDGTTGLLRLT